MVFLLFVAVGVLGFVVFRLNGIVEHLQGLQRESDIRLDDLQREFVRIARRLDAPPGPPPAEIRSRPAEPVAPLPVSAGTVLSDTPPTVPGPVARATADASPLQRDQEPPEGVPAVIEPVMTDVGLEPPEFERPEATAPPPMIPAGRIDAEKIEVGTQAADAEDESPAFDWERLVGVKFFSAIAGIALVVAAIFFLRFSIEQGWLGPRVRVVIGALTGLGLLGFSERRAAGRYRVTADALDTAGITILYATFFAAHAMWALVGTFVTFILLVAVTVVAILLALRRSSPLIAGLGLLGGFAAPALLSAGQDNPFSLFGYLVVLNIGLAWVARDRRWAMLTGASLVLTTLYQWAWVLKYLTPETMPIAVGILVVFPVLAAVLLVAGRMTGRGHDDGVGWQGPFRRIAVAALILPLLATPMLAAPPYGGRFGWLFFFLLLLSVGYLVMAVALRNEQLHLLGAAAAVGVTLLWTATAYTQEAWPGVLGIVAGFVLLYASAPWLARRFGAPFAGDGRHASLAPPLLLLAFVVLVRRVDDVGSTFAIFSVLLPLLAVVTIHAVVWRYPAAYAVGAAAAILTELAWSARSIGSEDAWLAVAVYATFGIVLLVVPTVVRRLQREIEPAFVWLGLSGLLFQFRIASDPLLAVPPWPLLVGMVMLAAAAAMIAVDERRADIQVASSASLIGLCLAFQLTAREAPWPALAVAVAVAVSAVSLGWTWAAGRLGITGRAVESVAVVGTVGAQMVAIAATTLPGAPPLAALVGVHVVLLVSVLAVSWRTGWQALAPISVVVLGYATLFWATSPHTGADWRGVLLFASVPYALFVVYPHVLGRRAGHQIAPSLTAVLANIPFFVAARWSLLAGGFSSWLGLLPLFQAAVMAVHLAMLLRIEPRGAREPGRLAMVAAAVLAGITLAVPLQFERQWLTLGWALEGGALAWLFTRIPHRGLLWWCAGLLAAAFGRLALNPDVFAYAERSATPVFNWYLYTYATCAGAFLTAAWLLRSRDDRLIGDDSDGRFAPLRLSGAAAAGAVVLLFLLVNIEVADFYSVGETITFGFGVTLAQDLTYTLAWGIFAVVLLATGIVTHARGARVAALALLVVTVLKCFLYDLSRLEGLYRVASFVGLAVCLAFVAVALQKYVLGGRKSPV